MKYLIYKDSSQEQQLNHQIGEGLQMVQDILTQFKKTNLKPITDKETLQAFFADPVLFVSNQVQASANLGAWKVSPSKIVELLDEPEVTSLLQMVQSSNNQPVYYALNFGKFAKNGWEVDRETWAAYLEKMCCHYAESKKQEKVFHALQKLIDTLQEINTFGVPVNNLVNEPLKLYLRSNGDGQPITINLAGFNYLSRE
jgi:hypothetical protein